MIICLSCSFFISIFNIFLPLLTVQLWKDRKGGRERSVAGQNETWAAVKADMIAGLTFGDLELVVLLVPQTAALVVHDPDGKLGVWTVGRFQGEIRGCSTKKKKNNSHESDESAVGFMISLVALS